MKKQIWKGSKYHEDIKFNRRKDVHNKSIRNNLHNHGREVTEELKKIVSTGSRSGRIYLYKGTPYQASAPGEPPAKRSGRLADSFESKVRTYELRIGSTAFSDKGAPYPFYLVTGTKRGGKVFMEPRPYFLTTINRLNPRLQISLGRL